MALKTYFLNLLYTANNGVRQEPVISCQSYKISGYLCSSLSLSGHLSRVYLTHR